MMFHEQYHRTEKYSSCHIVIFIKHCNSPMHTCQDLQFKNYFFTDQIALDHHVGIPATKCTYSTSNKFSGSWWVSKSLLLNSRCFIFMWLKDGLSLFQKFALLFSSRHFSVSCVMLLYTSISATKQKKNGRSHSVLLRETTTANNAFSHSLYKVIGHQYDLC